MVNPDMQISQEDERVLAVCSKFYEQRFGAQTLFWFADMKRRFVRVFYLSRRKLFRKPREKLVLVLHTSGGDIDAAYMLVQVLRSLFRELRIVVPAWAKSAGTLVCLAADSLVMSRIAELGPLDPQIYKPGDAHWRPALDSKEVLTAIGEEASTIIQVVAEDLTRKLPVGIHDVLPHSANLAAKLLQPILRQLSPSEIGSIERLLRISAEYADRILSQYREEMTERQRLLLVRRLAYGYPSHSFVIDRHEAARLGLPVADCDELEECVLDALHRVIDNDGLIGTYPFVEPGEDREQRQESEHKDGEENEPNEQSEGNTRSERSGGEAEQGDSGPEDAGQE